MSEDNAKEEGELSEDDEVDEDARPNTIQQLAAAPQLDELGGKENIQAGFRSRSTNEQFVHHRHENARAAVPDLMSLHVNRKSSRERQVDPHHNVVHDLLSLDFKAKTSNNSTAHKQQFINTAVPELMSLDVQPSVKSFNNSSVPLSAQAPCPLLLRPPRVTSRSVASQKPRAVNKRTNKMSCLSAVEVNDGDDSDTDFRDMLLEYSLVKSRLQKLNQQENISETRDSRTNSKCKKDVEVISVDSASDEEELDLRRAALKSAAEKSENIRSHTRRLPSLPHHRQPSPPVRRHLRSSSQRLAFSRATDRPFRSASRFNVRHHQRDVSARRSLEDKSNRQYSMPNELRARRDKVKQSTAKATVSNSRLSNRHRNLIIDLTKSKGNESPSAGSTSAHSSVQVIDDNYEQVEMEIDESPSPPPMSVPISGPTVSSNHSALSWKPDDSRPQYILSQQCPTSQTTLKYHTDTDITQSSVAHKTPCNIPLLPPCSTSHMPPHTTPLISPHSMPLVPPHTTPLISPHSNDSMPLVPLPLFQIITPHPPSLVTLQLPMPAVFPSQPPLFGPLPLNKPIIHNNPPLLVLETGRTPEPLPTPTTEIKADNLDRTDNHRKTTDGMNVNMPTVTALSQNSMPSPAAAGTDEQNEDEDCDETEALLLRAKLLMCVTKKRKQQSSANFEELNKNGSRTGVSNLKPLPVAESEANSSRQIPVVISRRKTAAETQKVHFPKHERVVITLAEESSSSDEETSNHSSSLERQQQTSEGTFQSSLNKLLRDARLASAANAETESAENQVKKPFNITLESLPTAESVLSQSSAKPTTSTVQLKKSLQVSVDSNDARTVLSKSAVAIATDKALVDKCMKRRLLIEQQIVAEKEQLKEDEAGLMLTRLKMTRKKGQLRAAEIRAQKLREQLAAAEKIISSNVKQVDSLSMKLLVAQRITERRHQRLESLKADMAEATKHLVRAKQRLTTRAGNAGSVAGHRSTDEDRKLSASEIAQEKDRLEELAKQYAALIEIHKAKRLKRLSSQTVNIDDKSAADSNEVSTITVVDNAASEMCLIKPAALSEVGNKDTAAAGCRHDEAGRDDEWKQLSQVQIQQLTQQHHDQLLRYVNQGKMLFHNCSMLRTTDPVLSFHTEISALPSDIAKSIIRNSKAIDTRVSNFFKPYRSSLRCLRAYKFSPYYRLKEGLSVASVTFSNKINPYRQLCQFDLMGKCLDETCSCQHKVDYTMSHRELLIDLVSYQPSLAGISPSTQPQEYQQLIGHYVDTLIKHWTGNMTDAEQCLAVVSQVNKAAGHSAVGTTFTQARSWRPQTSKPLLGLDSQRFLELLLQPKKTLETDPDLPDRDSTVTVDDVRYWMPLLPTQNANNVSSDAPTNVEAWIKLAYKKLNEMKHGTSKSSEYLDRGINILVRGIEANPSSSLLWLHYLDLFSQRAESQTELTSVCEQAIQCAPSYNLLWKCLQLLADYSTKIELCKKLRRFLCSPLCTDDPVALKSHRLVEVVLYQVSLSSMAGHIDSSLQTLQSIVQASVVWQNLTPSDRILIWLCYLHLKEHEQLPAMLFDPSNSNPGCIVSKKPFVMSWETNKERSSSCEEMMELMDAAILSCSKDSSEDGEYVRWLSALYCSRISLELVVNGVDNAQQLCLETVHHRPQLIDVWIQLIRLMSQGAVNTGKEVILDVRTIVDKALTANRHSIELHLAAMNICLESCDADAALHYAEQCPISLFSVDGSEPTIVDPNILYCVLLNQPVPANYRVPYLLPAVSQQYVDQQQSNLWISYCVLLDLQGAIDQATEAYHSAICSVTATSDLHKIWVAFLRRFSNILLGTSPWLPYSVDEDTKRRQWTEFSGLVDRAINSLPTKRIVPYSAEPERTWLDYSPHNDIIDIYLSCVSSSVEVTLYVYDRYIHLMPYNTQLTLKACQFLLSNDYNVLCRGYCLLLLAYCPKCLPLWYCYLLASREDDSHTRAIYRQATVCLPFSINLWKSYILFEIVEGSSEQVQAIVGKCQQLKLDLVSEFVSNVLKESSAVC